MVAVRAKQKRQVRMAALTNVRLHVDATGLVTNTNNSYGQVDGSNNIVSWKGLATGSIADTMTVNGSGVTFDTTTKSIAFNGSGRLRSGQAASVWDFMSYAASFGNLDCTIYMVCKIGTTYKPSSVNYGFLGTNGGSTVNKGLCIFYTNNNGTTEDQLSGFISKGTAATYIARQVIPGALPSNQWCVLTMKMDAGEADGVRMRYYLNDQALLFNEELDNNNTPVTTPTYTLEIGSCGNAALPFVGNIKEVIITQSAENYQTSISIIRQLMNKHGITRSRASDYLNTSLVPEIFDQTVGTSGFLYHLCAVISQDPTNRNRICSAYNAGPGHLYDATRKIVGRVSLVKGAPFMNSFGAEFDIYNPSGANAPIDCGGGFDQNGVMHIITDVINSSSAGGCVGVTHLYSSDLSSWTTVDITASLPSDGLAAWRMYGNMVHANGIWVKPFYKLTDHGDTTQSANYIFRSTNGTSWTSVTVRAPGATYINEASIAYLGSSTWIYIARNESTKEWTQYISTDNAQTWSSQGDITFGETVATANPMMLKTFTHNGVLCVAAYITNRDNDTAFVIYAKASSIIASGVSGWDLDTKLMWWKTGLAPFHYHYCDYAHLDDTIRAVGACIYDAFPLTDGSVSKVNYTVMPTWHVSKIESELGI